MPRLIEILLFVAPLLGFIAWRLLFPSPLPPLWLVCGLGGFVVLMLLALIWARHIDAGDANQPYIPSVLEDGRVVPGQSKAPPKGPT